MKVQITKWAAAWLVCTASLASAQGFQPLHFQMTAYIKTDNRSRSESSHIWMKATDRYRIEQSAGAQNVITIANGADLWQVDRLRNTCQHRKDADTVRKLFRQTLAGVNVLDTFRKQGAKRGGQAKIDGVLCTAYRRRDKSGMTYTVWALPTGRVRRITSEGTMRGAASLGEAIETHSLESRADVKWLDPKSMDESLFRPPAGMAVTEARK